MSDKKTIFVTGGAGYIGSHIVLCLLLTGQYKVVSLDNSSNSFPTALKRVSEIAVSELPATASAEEKASLVVDVISGDITKAQDVEAVFKKYESQGGIYGVIHVAALKAVGESSEIPLSYYQTNVGATIQLLQIMEKFNVFRFVYSSSATVYGAPKNIPIPETEPLGPESPYGRTKYISELILRDMCNSKPGVWKAISLRYFNPAGAHKSGLIGEDPRGKPGNLLPLLAQIAVGKYKPPGGVLQVFGDDYPTPDGTCVRDYIHVMDLAQGHVDAVSALDKETTFASVKDETSKFGGAGGFFKAYNLGKGKGMSVLNMVEAMRKASGFDYQIKVVGRRTGDVPDLTADPALAEKELGFKAPHVLEEMCRDLWNWQSKNPKGYES